VWSGWAPIETLAVLLVASFPLMLSFLLADLLSLPVVCILSILHLDHPRLPVLLLDRIRARNGRSAERNRATDSMMATSSNASTVAQRVGITSAILDCLAVVRCCRLYASLICTTANHATVAPPAQVAPSLLAVPAIASNQRAPSARLRSHSRVTCDRGTYFGELSTELRLSVIIVILLARSPPIQPVPEVYGKAGGTPVMPQERQYRMWRSMLGPYRAGALVGGKSTKSYMGKPPGALRPSRYQTYMGKLAELLLCRRNSNIGCGC
jgi:hypothetical protein